MQLRMRVDGRDTLFEDRGASLLEVLRDQLGVRSPKDGCSPQGQCGCCTVLVDGSPRVACVTPARRVADREITTLDGLDPATRDRWVDAFLATGASQCGFCTPGILVRLAGLEATRDVPLDREAVEQAMLAHLCRCTGWRTIVEAAGVAAALRGETTDAPGTPAAPRDLDAASRRATIEGGAPQRVARGVIRGEGGFADDGAPLDALVAVADGSGGWAVAETLGDVRRHVAKVQGRRSPGTLTHPLDLPLGEWALTLRTTWVEPAYLELDASWCAPGGEPSSPLANGGAFGSKRDSPVAAAARELANRHGRPVRVLMAREDVVRDGPKRPPISAGVRDDGTGVLRVARTEGAAELIRRIAPAFDVEEVDVAGPRTSLAPRAALWAECAVLTAALAARGSGAPIEVRSPDGAAASASVAGGEVLVEVACGDPLDEVVLRSYCVGAAHQALGWVTSEGLALDPHGAVQDLTIRSFGIVRARDMPPVSVHIAPGSGEPVNGSDAVFAAVAAAVWLDRGLPPEWPTDWRTT